MVIAPPPTRATWRTILGEAIGPARFVVDLEGARGEWRLLLEQNGCVLLEPDLIPPGGCDAVVARHLLSRLRDPQRELAGWLALVGRGGRVVLLEAAARGGPLGFLLPRPGILFPAQRIPDPAAPYRRGLAPAEASLLFQCAGCSDVRCFALPSPGSAALHYLVSARRR